MIFHIKWNIRFAGVALLFVGPKSNPKGLFEP
jgi:hypothetical protein